MRQRTCYLADTASLARLDSDHVGNWPPSQVGSRSSRSEHHHDNGPAGTYTVGRLLGDGASIFSGAPPSYLSHSYGPTQSNDLEERRPLLSGFPQQKTDTRLFLIWPMAYFVYSLVFVPSQVVLYKNLYDNARVQVHHLLNENSALVSEVDNLREHLNKTKVEAFWEIARFMDTNMYVASLVNSRRVYNVAQGCLGGSR
jgi:hypothetical protein